MGSAVIHCEGHPAIRATHAKTLELSGDADIGARATCVVGVRARADEDALLALRGRVMVTVACGDERDTFGARMNPAFERGAPLIARCRGAVTPRAFLVDADKGARDLSRRLVERLAHAGAHVVVTVTEEGGADGARGASASGASGATDTSADRARGASAGGASGTADASVGAPGGGVLLVVPTHAWALGAAGDAGAALARADLRLTADAPAEETATALEAVRRGARAAVVADLRTDHAAVVRLVRAALDAGLDVLPAPGSGPAAATAAVAGVPLSPLTLADADDLAAALAGAGSVLAHVDRGGFDRAAAAAREARPRARCCAGVDVGGPHQQLLHAAPGEPLPRLPSTAGEQIVLVVGPDEDAAAGPAGTVEATTLAAACVAEGLSTRSTARVLQGTLGLPRRDAYALALAAADRDGRDPREP